MRFFNALAAILLPIFLLASCTGSGVVKKEDALAVTRSAGPNTAVFFWPRSFIPGLERLAFYQNDQFVAAISQGQVTTLPLESGPNEFSVAWEEALRLPLPGSVKNWTFIGRENGPSYFIVYQRREVIFDTRGIDEVSKSEFIAEIEKSKKDGP